MKLKLILRCFLIMLISTTSICCQNKPKKAMEENNTKEQHMVIIWELIKTRLSRGDCVEYAVVRGDVNKNGMVEISLYSRFLEPKLGTEWQQVSAVGFTNGGHHESVAIQKEVQESAVRSEALKLLSGIDSSLGSTVVSRWEACTGPAIDGVKN